MLSQFINVSKKDGRFYIGTAFGGRDGAKRDADVMATYGYVHTAIVRITVTAKGKVTAKVIPVKKRKERTTDGR